MKTPKHQKKTHHNKKVAANRGKSWRKNLVRGKLEAAQNPTKLKLERTQKGDSQASVASSIKSSVSTYGAIERGKRPVSKETGLAISKHLNRSLNHFFSLDGKKYIAKS
jgi:DNA-binding XRE family transcriptional regulator